MRNQFNHLQLQLPLLTSWVSTQSVVSLLDGRCQSAHLYLLGRSIKFLLSSATHFPSGQMSCAFSALIWWVAGKWEIQTCRNYSAPPCYPLIPVTDTITSFYPKRCPESVLSTAVQYSVSIQIIYLLLSLTTLIKPVVLYASWLNIPGHIVRVTLKDNAAQTITEGHYWPNSLNTQPSAQVTLKLCI